MRRKLFSAGVVSLASSDISSDLFYFLKVHILSELSAFRILYAVTIGEMSNKGILIAANKP